jgi:hypothetical protein
MKRLAAIIAALVVLAGCNSAPSSMNFLAPYGTTRVPPPSTGSYRQPDTYYQPGGGSGSAGGAVGSGLSQSTREADSDSEDKVRFGGGVTENPIAAGANPNRTATISPIEDSNVRLASATQPASAEPPVRILESEAASTDLRSRLKGMPVNDMTQPPARAEPAPFVPNDSARDLSEFPRPPASATQPSVPLRTIEESSTQEASHSKAHRTDSDDEPLRWGTRSGTDSSQRVVSR